MCIPRLEGEVGVRGKRGAKRLVGTTACPRVGVFATVRPTAKRGRHAIVHIEKENWNGR